VHNAKQHLVLLLLAATTSPALENNLSWHRCSRYTHKKIHHV